MPAITNLLTLKALSRSEAEIEYWKIRAEFANLMRIRGLAIDAGGDDLEAKTACRSLADAHRYLIGRFIGSL